MNYNPCTELTIVNEIISGLKFEPIFRCVNYGISPNYITTIWRLIGTAFLIYIMHFICWKIADKWIDALFKTKKK